MDTRDNRVLGGRILLRQPVKGFRSGSDAVLLAAAAHPPANGHIVDLGCGTGSAMLCVAARRPGTRVTGVEIDRATADLAAFNIQRNGLANRGGVLVSDVADPDLCCESADTVVANPPYFSEATHRISPDADRNRARAETVAGLQDWIVSASRILKPGGEAVFILRSERVTEARAALPASWYMTVMPVYGNPDRPPKRSLIRFGRRQMPPSANPIYLHHPGGAETALAQAVFRHGAPIFWR